MNGHWTATGEVNLDSACGSQVPFNLPSRMLQGMGVHESAAPALNIIKKTIANARDVFSSPHNDLLVVLAGSTSLVVLKPTGAGFGSPLLTLTLKYDEMPVMAEWALGDGAERWSRQLEEAARQGLAEPSVAEEVPLRP